MIKDERSDRLPKPDLSRLHPLSPADVAFAFVASYRGHVEKKDALEAVSQILEPALAEKAFQDAAANGALDDKDGTFLAKPLAEANGTSQPRIVGGGWRQGQQNLALRAVSGAPSRTEFYGIRKSPDLAAAALRQIYSLKTPSAFPSRAEVRCALVQRIVSTLGPKFEAALSRPLKTFKFDALSRSLYLVFAGLEGGTVMQADAALLRSAFGVSPGGSSELAVSIIQLAIKAGQQAAADASEAADTDEKAFDLDTFTQSIRKLARTLETKPYTGRVAIAQVYDAGLAKGLELGSLEEFKLHIAEAAREGLLDLERYDIAGPFDPALKERSRLRLGRDERHFIVNQWI